ncbi:hypothetical protein POM88_007208 [Heracleum sosnowskyi]|uniref:Uncharacterized protein n=2 Tax=Heracleum sosnowskyi TaxID=360622 RepID=A0AAD8J7P7_9APIA|nr:hypothetical protein POM88_007208 [Heracleum sosnowskyi]
MASSLSFRNSPNTKFVPLSDSLNSLYLSASRNVLNEKVDWDPEKMSDIHTHVDYAKQQGRFASTDFEYSVFLLGTRCLDENNPQKETIIKEVYACKLNKVQHAVFGRNVGGNEEVVADVDVYKRNQLKVADDLAVLFTGKPMLREQVRKEWMEHLSYEPHTEAGDKFLACYLYHECSFLIKEYLKHGPEVGLSVAEYIDLTSILFKHCNPVECLDHQIDQKKSFALKHPFTKAELSSKLISPPDPDQPIPREVICECTAGHYCMLIEVRYKFLWKHGKLVNRAVKRVRTRIESCEIPDNAHNIYYFTEKDRLSYKQCLEDEGKIDVVDKIKKIVIDKDGFVTVTKGKGRGRK